MSTQQEEHNLKREDELKDLGEMSKQVIEEIVEKVETQESQKNLSSQEEEEQPLKREDELTNLSELPKPVIEKALDKIDKNETEENKKNLPSHNLLDKIKEGFSDIASKLSDQIENLKEKLMKQEGKKEEKGEENEPLVLEGKDEARDITGKLSEALEKSQENVSGRITEKAEEIGEKALPLSEEGSKKSEGEEKSFTQKFQEGVATIVRKISETLEETADQIFPRTGQEIESGQHPVRDKIKDVMHEISDDMTLTYDADRPKGQSIEKKEAETKEEPSETISKNIELAPTEEIHPREFKDFKEVKSGFSETVKEFKEEQRIEDVGQKSLSSDNPFEVLANKNLNIAQPLGQTEVVGGELPLSSGPKTLKADTAEKFVRASETENVAKENKEDVTAI